MTQIVTPQQLISLAPSGATPAAQSDVSASGAIYEFEPSEEEILSELLPNNLAVQIFTALLENAAASKVRA